MSGVAVAAEVTDLKKVGPGYAVAVEFVGGGFNFALAAQTSAVDPNEAIEIARKRLYEFAVAMARALDQPGSLA